MPKRRCIQFVYIALLVISLTLGQLLPQPALEVSADGYIKWVDFTLTAELLRAAAECDIASWQAARESGQEQRVHFVELLALCGAIYGGNYSRLGASKLKEYAAKLEAGATIYDLTENHKNLEYYLEAYGAALGGVMGDYAVYTSEGLSKRYGVKLFSPIAAGYYYNDYDDFGASRSYGYRRPHLGHDMMGSVGTPIVAVESGYVEACGWNQYGGWRIGIRSYDGKRYYYYAHLRRGHPYNDIYEGKQITAGEVIGYLGMTGYSTKEDTNNIDTPHLHFGLQLIFDESQKDGTNQIWLDLYEYTIFLSRLRSEVYYDKETNEFYAASPILDLDAPD